MFPPVSHRLWSHGCSLTVHQSTRQWHTGAILLGDTQVDFEKSQLPRCSNNPICYLLLSKLLYCLMFLNLLRKTIAYAFQLAGQPRSCHSHLSTFSFPCNLPTLQINIESQDANSLVYWKPLTSTISKHTSLLSFKSPS